MLEWDGSATVCQQPDAYETLVGRNPFDEYSRTSIDIDS
jgi:hypothetical protein